MVTAIGSKRRVAAVTCLAAVAGVGWVLAAIVDEPVAQRAPEPRAVPARPAPPKTASDAKPPSARRTRPLVRWRDSVALGEPHAGSLRRGVGLPAAARHFRTWDPILRRSPSRRWRRHGTDDLVRMVLRVSRRYAAAEPGARPMLVGDLSRPRGGDFGPRYGSIGHITHQNGLDVDVYYPRTDRRLEVPDAVAEVDRRLSQRLVDLFVAAGARTVLVGPNVGLTGPPSVVKPFPNHDNHLHVRIANPARSRP